MLIEFRDAPVMVDKQPFIEDIRLNIQGHQLRLKMNYINGDTTKPVDLVVFDWKFKLDKFQGSISVDGQELNSKKDLVFKVSYDIIKRRLMLVGKLCDKEVNEQITSIEDFLKILKSVL